MEPRKIKSADEARSCLAAATASGLPRSAWARSHGINARSLNAWRMLLRPLGGPEGLRVVELVPNLRVGTRCMPAKSSAGAPAAIYRVCCGPFEVEAPSDFDEPTLTRLLRVVAASC